MIANERVKLTATFLNGLAVAIIALGAFAPLVSGTWSWSKAAVCLVTGVVLHLTGRQFLNRLQP